MYIYSSLHVGDYFLFLPFAGPGNPVRIGFKEQSPFSKQSKNKDTWRENIHLAPAILSRKWIDYKYKDRFIPAVKYDNVLPCGLEYRLVNEAGCPVLITLATSDKQYKNIELQILDEDGFPAFRKFIERLTPRSDAAIEAVVKKPGIYRVALFDGFMRLEKSSIFFVAAGGFPDETFSFQQVSGGDKVRFFCGRCGCHAEPMKPGTLPRYIYKNYIPFKEYLDLEKLGGESVIRSVMNLRHPLAYKRGLVQLLNIIRLATVEDELTIVANLFKDNPSFAYFVTDRLFILGVIPLMEDKALQTILASMDDALIARGILGEEREITEKILRNLSARRRAFVLQTFHRNGVDAHLQDARDELGQRLRLYFEERIGRVLKMPAEDRLVYFPQEGSDGATRRKGDLLCHSGEVLLLRGKEVLRCRTGDGGERCARFDAEWYKDSIFTVAGVSASSLFLQCKTPLRSAFVHSYHWHTALEDVEFIEHVPYRAVIPIPIPASALVLTIGAIGEDGTPMEQVYRLRIREAEEPQKTRPVR